MTRTKPPGPDGLPFIGTGLDYVRNPFEFRERSAEEYGDVVHVRNFGMDVYMVAAPEVVEEVLVTDSENYVRSDIVKDHIGAVFGEGLLLSDGDFWKRQRQLIQPAFYRERMPKYTQMMTDRARTMADSWNHGDTCDVQEEMEKLALEILVNALFGTDIERKRTVMSAVDAFLDKFDPSKLMRTMILPDWVPTPTNRGFQQAIDDLENIIYDTIQARRNEDGLADREDMLAMLLTAETEEGVSMSDETVRDEMMSMLLAGHETTALALTYTWDQLARNPEIERKLHEELEEVLGGRTPTFEDLPDLEYTDKLVTETLRMYPPAHEIRRQPVKDVELGGYHVPEGSLVSCSVWVVQHDDRWYDDPHTYRPERWTEEFRSQLPEYAYFPFGGGPHLCIGQQFSLIESKLVPTSRWN
ncbi:cytochrome P450 [Halobacteriales archaeon QS_1_68_20]|nr:MAG: cytochrome P450 [Halobacteriales archaeon QS_1_68_20]